MTTTLIKKQWERRKVCLGSWLQEAVVYHGEEASQWLCIHMTTQSGQIRHCPTQGGYHPGESPPLATHIPPARSYSQTASQPSKLTLWGCSQHLNPESGRHFRIKPWKEQEFLKELTNSDMQIHCIKSILCLRGLLQLNYIKDLQRRRPWLRQGWLLQWLQYLAFLTISSFLKLTGVPLSAAQVGK